MKAKVERLSLRPQGKKGEIAMAVIHKLPPSLKRKATHFFWKIGWLVQG